LRDRVNTNNILDENKCLQTEENQHEFGLMDNNQGPTIFCGKRNQRHI